MFGIPASCLWVSVVGASADRRHWSDRLASLPRCHICNPLCNPIYFILVYQWKNCPGIVRGFFFLFQSSDFTIHVVSNFAEDAPAVGGLVLCHSVEENWELTAPAAGQTKLLNRYYSHIHKVEPNKRK